MANIENIIKVMNFHSLLRVDKSKKQADKFLYVEEKLNNVMCEIYYNKNLVLDKKNFIQNKKGDTINIYIGNDLGFCGNFNSLIITSLKKDKIGKKIIIGKKIHYIDDSTIMMFEKEKFNQYYNKIQELMYSLISTKKLKEVNIIYNHYYNTNDIKFEIKKIFPIEFVKPDNINLKVDYISETNITKILNNLISYYICYEIKIAEANSLASENIMREKITHEAKTKISTRNIEKEKEIRKNKKYKNFKKQLGNYRKVDD